MNTVTPTAPVVNSVNWFVPTVSVPFIFGEQDARDGVGCVPEMHWTHIDDQRDYCAGFASVAGHNVTTRQFLGGNS